MHLKCFDFSILNYLKVVFFDRPLQDPHSARHWLRPHALSMLGLQVYVFMVVGSILVAVGPHHVMTERAQQDERLTLFYVVNVFVLCLQESCCSPPPLCWLPEMFLRRLHSATSHGLLDSTAPAGADEIVWPPTRTAYAQRDKTTDPSDLRGCRWQRM